MIKRIICVLLFILMLSPATAYADVVWGNEFQARNRESTVQVRRSFYINSVDGYLVSRAGPGAEIIMRGDGGWREGEGGITYENGRVVRISDAYNHNGRYWGLVDWGGHGGPDGWVPMDELLLRYEASDFDEEHSDSFFEFAGNFDTLLDFERFFIWRWPGSDREKITYEHLGSYLKGEEWGVSVSDVAARHAYLDDEGRKWVYITIWPEWSDYGFGYAAGWVLISDPANRDIPAFYPAPEPIYWWPGEEPDWHGDSHRSPPPLPVSSTNSPFGNLVQTGHIVWVVVALTFLLIAGTIILIVILRKPKSVNGSDNQDIN